MCKKVEWRDAVELNGYPGHGRRRRWRLADYQIEDQKLVAVHATYRFQTAGDLARLVKRPIPQPFHTGHLAESLQVHRWMAQRIAYCFRQMGTVREVGRQGNTRLYEFAAARRAG